MRGWMKACLFAGGFCIAIGGGIAIAARVMGAEWNGMYYDDNKYFDSFRENKEKLRALKPDLGLLEDSEDSYGDGDYYSDVRELKLDIAVGSVEILQGGSGDEVRVVYSPEMAEYLTVVMENGELKIKTGSFRRWLSDDDENREIEIYVPDGYYFEEVEAEVGVGGIEAETLNAGKLELKAKAGGIIIRNGDIGELEAKCTAGGIEYTGRVDGDIEAECSTGGITLRLEGEQTDYDYELKCQMGFIKIQEDSYYALAAKEKIDNQAGRKLELECQTGGIEVTFEEDL